MQNLKNISQEILHKLFDYNKCTGQLIRKPIDLEVYDMKTNQVNSWNAKNAGKVVGALTKKDGYLRCGVLGETWLVHRLVWIYHNGYLDENLDHINGIRSDNRIENLRKAKYRENSFNRGAQKNNTVGYKGVSIHKQTGKYRAKIWADKKQHHLGLFLTAELAHEAYCKAATILHKEFAKFN